MEFESDVEDNQLDEAAGVTAKSRLGCQCVPDGSRDIVVEIPEWNKNYAKEAGVTNKKFLTELVDCIYGWTVRNDLLEAVDKGIRDVPALFINDVLYTGHITTISLGKAIDEALKASGGRKKTAQRA